eukprot:1156734-Pelagomonas_calceolata.AAC.1
MPFLGSATESVASRASYAYAFKRSSAVGMTVHEIFWQEVSSSMPCKHPTQANNTDVLARSGYRPQCFCSAAFVGGYNDVTLPYLTLQKTEACQEARQLGAFCKDVVHDLFIAEHSESLSKKKKNQFGQVLAKQWESP